ncbi:hypothetical protein HCN51_55000 [Nonomuraea sp. FMUSA5-5]|uniref:Uncharacterized protein n=1 Tax=Nonomuraea composti TaxID=2720023 RepID=A0ABX1BL28_9ACTN|nr:hypothetical protein [Nonomuraea sp. FMUSA5-5]NJP98439.1 hypothetical protein [Nonomuraea sp. FMUSA5-5]
MEILREGISVTPAGIAATLKYWCTTSPVPQQTALRLQIRDTTGRWVTMDQRPRRGTALTVAAAYFPGLWRARGTAVGALRGTRACFRSGWVHSQVSITVM